jgi:hypothetical protein
MRRMVAPYWMRFQEGMAMKVELRGPDGEPRGEMEVPDEIVDAANKVCTWLTQQESLPNTRERVAAVCGVCLHVPPEVARSTNIDRIAKDAKPDTQRKLWWQE